MYTYEEGDLGLIVKEFIKPSLQSAAAAKGKREKGLGFIAMRNTISIKERCFLAMEGTIVYLVLLSSIIITIHPLLVWDSADTEEMPEL